MDKIIVGNEEWCALPDLGVPAIRARVDSGAKTSAIHAANIQRFEKDGQDWVRFEVLPLQKNSNVVIKKECPIHDVRRIKNTSGILEQRYVIRTTLSLGGVSWPIQVNLANRDAMGYRMLLGREAMLDRLLVDPAGSMHLRDVSNEELQSFYADFKKDFSSLNIGVLASNPELYSNRRLMEAGEERGHNMSFLNIKHCYLKLDSTNPEVHYRGGSVLTELDAVIPRIRPSISFYGCAVVRQFEAMGTMVLNTSQAITQSRDKLFASQQFAKHGLGMPVTGVANSPLDTNELIKMVGGAPMIVKLLEGTQGKGVVLAETKKAGESLINAFKSLNANLLVQEFIQEARGEDIRCFVVDNKVVASMMRQAAPGEFRANIHQGGKALAVKITPEEKKLALKATKILGLDVAGVDIIRGEKGPMLLEVNSSPGLQGIESVSEKDIAGSMIRSIEKKLGWKRTEG
jgi:ribosomal protein S6--L-glutamate ligase